MNQLLLDRCSSRYTPTTVEDFIGSNIVHRQSGDYTGAKAVATLMVKLVATAKANRNASIKVLLNGVPGIGKSDLAKFLQHLCGCNKWSTTKLNGTELKVERVEEIARSLAYKSLFGEYRMLWVDEADEIPRVAQVRILTLLDDLPESVAVVCTSNCQVKDFEERFQTRFQVFNLAPPPDTDIAGLLIRLAPAVRNAALQIATFAGGNVRQALLDAQGVIHSQAA